MTTAALTHRLRLHPGLTLTVETTDGRRVGKVLVVRTRDGEGVSDDEADR